MVTRPHINPASLARLEATERLPVNRHGRALELPAVVDPLLEVWDHLTAQIAAADAQVTAIAETDPVVQQLTTAPGVGPLIATACQAGLCPAR